MNQTNVPKKVAVIGAGYTGLVAALRLGQCGFQVSIFEAAPEIGGLAGGFSISGASLEKAYHHLFITDKDILSLVDELRIADEMEWLASQNALVFERIVYPFSGAIDLLRFKPLPFVDRIRTGLVSLYLTKTRNWGQFKTVTALDWMIKNAGAESVRVIWEPLLRAKFGSHFDKVSMAWLWARIHTRANSKENRELQEKLGYFKGGFQTLTNAIQLELDRLNVQINRNTKVTISSAKENKYEISAKDTKSELFDAVLATIPSSSFAKMASNLGLKENYIEKLNSIPYLNARVMIFSSMQNLSDFYWHNINDVDLPFLVIINHTRLTGTSRYSGKNIYYIATYSDPESDVITCSEAELQKLWFTGLKSVFPDFDSELVEEIHTFNFANAQHVVDTDYEHRIPEYAAGKPGLYLSNFSQIFPEDRGTNFAVREGNKVAKHIQNYLNQVTN